MLSLVTELRFALRRLRGQPLFAAVAITTLAVGIGASTALFSILNATLRRPLPFPAAERLVALWETTPDRSRVEAANYVDWRSDLVQGASPVFGEMAIYGSDGAALTGAGEAEMLRGARVSAGFFRVLGVEPLLGRSFLEEEDAPGDPAVVLLSAGVWRGRFGGDPSILGRVLTLDGVSRAVVGVMPDLPYPSWPATPARLRFDPAGSRYWIPAVIPREGARRRSHVYGVVARLAPGITLDGARARVDALAERMSQARAAGDTKEGIAVRPLTEELVGDVRPALLVLAGAVGLVLFVACTNVAGLMIARAAARRREFAVRAALGAGRAALARGLLAEGLLLAVAGGVAGVGLAWFGLDALLAAAPTDVLRITGSALDGQTLAVTLALTLFTTLGIALVPAVRSSRADVGEALRPGRRGSASADSRPGLRRGLVVAEVATALVLLVAAGLLVQSFERLRRVDPGFDGAGLVVAGISLPPSRFESWEKVAAFYDALTRRAASLPGVLATAISYDQPLDSNWTDNVDIEGRPPAAEGEERSARLHIVDEAYFRTLGVEIDRGRSFIAADDPAHPGAAIVNESLARLWFPGEDPIGKRILSGAPGYTWGDAMPQRFEIVGVAEDVSFLGLRGGSAPAVYLPARQFPLHDMTLLLRASGEIGTIAPALRAALAAQDKDIPLVSIRSMEGILADDTAEPRFSMLLMSLFGAVTLFLSAIGLYALLAQTVAHRTPEIGVRMALGASPREVARLVIGEGLALTLGGAAIGLAGALASGRMIAGLLFGIGAADPWTLGAAPLVLVAVATIACGLPALRAARVDPATVMRGE